MKKVFSQLLLSCSLILLSTVNANAQKDDDFNIPDDLGKGGLIILVASSSSDKVTKEILELFEENYKGKYEAATTQYPKASNYKKENYQYIFFVTEKMRPAQTIGKDRFPATTDYKFGLMDMRSGKRYEQDFWSGSYKKGGKSFIKKMEEVRKKNEGQ